MIRDALTEAFGINTLYITCPWMKKMLSSELCMECIFFYSCHPKCIPCSLNLGRDAYVPWRCTLHNPSGYTFYRDRAKLHINIKKIINAWNPLLALMYQDIGVIRIPFEWFEFVFESFESFSNLSNLHSNASNPFRMVRILFRKLRVLFKCFQFVLKYFNSLSNGLNIVSKASNPICVCQ